MLPLLTKYLIRYKKVCIPHVGTFEIVQQSPQLNVADKMFTSPGFKTVFNLKDSVSEHQFDFFASAEMEREKIRQELFSFGEKLKSKIHQSPFYWKGFGTIRYRSNAIIFDPEEIELASLEKIPAQKVLRENVQHNMLVGDQEMTSQQVTDVLNKVEYKRPWFMLAGWIIFILAVLIIIIFLYSKNFQTTATGLQTMY